MHYRRHPRRVPCSATQLTDRPMHMTCMWQGVEEYQNMIDLHVGEKKHIRMMQAEDAQWCETFERVIGPFEEKYDQCQRDVVKLAEHGKAVYNVSFQKLITEFGFHPAFKRWFDDF